MIHIAICDHHPMIRMGLVATVGKEQGMEVIYESTSLCKLLQDRPDIDPDIFVLDLDLDDKESLQSLIKLNQQYPTSKIIIYNTENHREQILRATQLGVYGFVSKNADCNDIITAILVVGNGGLSLGQNVREQLFSQTPQDSAQDTVLSPRERQVLQLLAKGNTNIDIAASLYVCERTVKFHVSSILKKLNLRNRTQAALYARQHNLSSASRENKRNR